MDATSTATTTIRSLDLEAIFLSLYRFLTGVEGSVSSHDWSFWLVSVWTGYTVIAYFISVGLIALLVYLSVREHQIAAEDEARYGYLPPEEAEDQTEHARWRHVETLIESASESEWRQAIIEADIMLDDVLASYGYPGDSVGEKLKAGDPARFRTLQDAWDAHKVRNDIAHQGSAFRLSEQMAHRTIAKYRNVFLEFQVIQ